MKEEEILFQEVPKPGKKVKVFVGRDVPMRDSDYRAPKYGVVISTGFKRITKTVDGKTTATNYQIVHLERCEPLETKDVDYFFDEWRVKFV